MLAFIMCLSGTGSFRCYRNLAHRSNDPVHPDAIPAFAIVTPGGDPVSLFALSIPLCIFYEASIWIARLMLGRRAKNREATDTAA